MIGPSDILKASLLIVDDQEANVTLLEQMLKGAGYVSVTSTRNPREVCELYRKNRYSLILLDLKMPEMDGFQVMEGLRAIETEGYLPVLVQTSQPDHKLRALKAGARDFVSKPFDLVELLLRVHNLIEVRLLHLESELRTKQAESREQALRASELSYRRLFEAAKDGILILDVDTGRINDVNPSLLEMLGFSLGEIVGKSLWEISPFKDLVSNKARFLQLQQKKYVRYDDVPLEARDGRRHAVEFVGSVYPAGGRDVIQCIIRDITERKQAEEQLKTSLQEVGDLNIEIRAFYHTLSHELKTPLTSAREFVSIVMDGLAGPLNDTQLEYLGIAKESCDQLRLYINDLLDVTRLETGKMSITFETQSLAALVERVVEMLAPAAVGKSVILSCDCQPDLPAVPVDKQRMLQVLTNLTTNAIKFTPAGGQIRLSLREAPADPGCLQIDVRDTGRGIPRDDLDQIFNRLYQVSHDDQPVESRNGLGLGLYICRELVDLHGGRIWAESEPGQGSTFSFAIPINAGTKCAHVLIVDDEEAIREMLRLLLEKENFEVTTAAGGIEALQRMDEKTPDVVVLDLGMPGLDGPGTLKEIRKRWGRISVIVYTGYPDGDLMRQAMEFSPFTLLAKSCKPKQFVETVQRLCRTDETRFLKKKARTHPAGEARSG